ncbi:MAG: putative methyltransferase [Alphaproteobacteria bacterium MarineAlpha4_Bin2]|nr:MAG: putative methyltransferase [Alphaproteobacteria bacterium MarineAlpha4_Bin2]
MSTPLRSTNTVVSDIKSNFDGLADNYSRNRPQYPQGLLRELNSLCKEGSLRVVDLASGTGISTRAVAKALGARAEIIGVEPSEDMRRRATDDTPKDAPISYLDGTAEALAFDDASLDLIFVGQALHWFDRPIFYSEAGRVLKPNGVIAIARNTRNWRKSNFVSEYEGFHEKYLPGFSRGERELDAAAECASLDWVGQTATFEEEWIRPMKLASFLGMAQSSSKVTRALRNAGWDNGIAELTVIAERHMDGDGFLVLPYLSELVCAVKRT